MKNSDSGFEVVSALFHAAAEAERALAEIKSAGYAHAEISEVDGGGSTGYGARADSDAETLPGGSFFREHEAHASAFLRELRALDFSRDDARHLVDSIVRGEILVTVDTAALGPVAAEKIFERYAARVYYARAGSSPEDDATVEAGVGLEERRTLGLREERLELDRRVQHGEARLTKRARA